MRVCCCQVCASGVPGRAERRRRQRSAAARSGAWSRDDDNHQPPATLIAGDTRICWRNACSLHNHAMTRAPLAACATGRRRLRWCVAATIPCCAAQHQNRTSFTQKPRESWRAPPEGRAVGAPEIEATLQGSRRRAGACLLLRAGCCCRSTQGRCMAMRLAAMVYIRGGARAFIYAPL